MIRPERVRRPGLTRVATPRALQIPGADAYLYYNMGHHDGGTANLWKFSIYRCFYERPFFTGSAISVYFPLLFLSFFCRYMILGTKKEPAPLAWRPVPALLSAVKFSPVAGEWRG